MKKETEDIERMKMAAMLKILKELRIANRNLCMNREDRSTFMSDDVMEDVSEMKLFAGLAFV